MRLVINNLRSSGPWKARSLICDGPSHNHSSARARSMSRCCILLLVPLMAMSCRSPQTERAVSGTHADPRGFKAVAKAPGDEAELDSLVRFVQVLKGSGHDIDRITRIQFASPTKATVDFLWSGGFHAGELEVAKENGAWTLVHEAYHP